jgi:large subunit ribosomal protein L5
VRSIAALKPGVTITVQLVDGLIRAEVQSIDAEAEKNQIADIQRDLALIAGQKPVLAKSKKAISNFKLRQGQTVGAYVTLRGDAMWDFLYRLLAVALPTIRDFRGVNPKSFDGNGNFSARALGGSDADGYPVPQSTFYAPGAPRLISVSLRYVF